MSHTLSDAGAPSRWYVMLFPSPEERAIIEAAIQRLAERIGGIPNPAPHVTVGYFHGSETPAAVTACVRPLTGPRVRVHASGIFSWSDQPHPLFGYTLSLRVRRDRQMQAWQRAVRDALSATALLPIFSWGEQQPHMNVLRGLPIPPHEALQLLSDREYPLTWVATRLVLSYQAGSEFPRQLDQPLSSTR